MARWTLTVRNGPRVERAHFETLEAALVGLEERIDELAPHARRKTVKTPLKEFQAQRLVSVRGEVAGPGRLLPAIRGGVDLRGDGSREAFVGHWRRRLVEPRGGESVHQGLRRALEQT
ncbi:MAG TPA: hypothetical protein VHX88_16095 [Solirubrobacteraceae bacterium]|nr:hypothetical protein [Solirubrobacteraceae bacterium]